MTEGVKIRVRKLEWEPVQDARYSGGVRPGSFHSGRYIIRQAPDGTCMVCDGRFTFIGQDFPDLEAAQDAVQAHHDKYILSELEFFE